MHLPTAVKSVIQTASPATTPMETTVHPANPIVSSHTSMEKCASQNVLLASMKTTPQTHVSHVNHLARAATRALSIAILVTSRVRRDSSRRNSARLNVMKDGQFLQRTLISSVKSVIETAKLASASWTTA